MVKVKAIDVNGLAGGNLTLNKVYVVVTKKENGNYIIKNDSNIEKSFKASRFQVVEDTSAVVTFKCGDVLRDNDEDAEYLLVNEGNLVALVDLETGEIINGFHPVADIEKITKADLELIDCADSNLVRA